MGMIVVYVTMALSCAAIFMKVDFVFSLGQNLSIWPFLAWNSGPSASASQMLGLSACATVLSASFVLLF